MAHGAILCDYFEPLQLLLEMDFWDNFSSYHQDLEVSALQLDLWGLGYHHFKGVTVKLMLSIHTCLAPGAWCAQAQAQSCRSV